MGDLPRSRVLARSGVLALSGVLERVDSRANLGDWPRLNLADRSVLFRRT
jgi:hypothetical protein